MTEDEYTVLTNRVCLSNALACMRDILAGDDYGITEEQRIAITKPTAEALMRIQGMISTDAEEN